MRWFFSLVAGILALALVIGGVIFIVQNEATHSYTFLRTTVSLPLWAVLGLAALAGFLIALLLVTPARAAADANHAQLRTHTRRLDRDLTDTRTANERLQAQLTTLQAELAVATRERDAYRASLDGLRAAPAPERTEAVAQSDRVESVPVAAEATPVAPQEAVAPRREADTAAPEPVETAGAGEGAPAEASAPQGGLGERLRTLFGQPEGPDADQTPQGPAAPA